MQKKRLALLLCGALLLSLAAGCGAAAEPDAPAAELSPPFEIVPAPEPEIPEETAELPPPESDLPEEEPVTEENEERFIFQPKVSSVYLDEIFGEEMVQTWYNLVDAVLAGEETFACPDQWTYDWVTGQFPYRCFPVLTEIIEPSYGGSVENGVAYVGYKVSREECEEKIRAFAALVEEVMNEAMRPEQTDMEKALALYSYFSHHYVYDYEAYEAMMDHYVEDLTATRFLTEGTGVCQEISTAYSYLLMQAGVNATIMMGSTGDMEAHQWSYVRIGGNDYHVDPTFVLTDPDYLRYFMMTDALRSTDCDPDSYTIASVYTQEYGAPDYRAEDDTFAPIWDSYLDSFDHDAHTLRCYSYDDFAERVYMEFDYEGF